MTHLIQIDRHAIQRLVQIRARPEAPLPAAIGEAVRSPKIPAGAFGSG
ncbi:MAG: hypothetical protein PVF97_09995 [Desulfobacterales bacterium]|jgi:hypothetical protein